MRFSSSSSRCAVGPSWTLLVRSLCALDALVYASAPPPRAAAATPTATHATTRCAPPREGSGEGRVSTEATASPGALCVSDPAEGFAAAGLVPVEGVATATVEAGLAGVVAGPAGTAFLPASALGRAGRSNAGSGGAPESFFAGAEAGLAPGSSGSASATCVSFLGAAAGAAGPAPGSASATCVSFLGAAGAAAGSASATCVSFLGARAAGAGATGSGGAAAASFFSFFSLSFAGAEADRFSAGCDALGGRSSAIEPVAGASSAASFPFTSAALVGSASGSARYASYCLRASALLPRRACASPMPIRYSGLMSSRYAACHSCKAFRHSPRFSAFFAAATCGSALSAQTGAAAARNTASARNLAIIACPPAGRGENPALGTLLSHLSAHAGGTVKLRAFRLRPRQAGQ